MANSRKRDYRDEYLSYHSKPEEIDKRAQRNAARAQVEKKVGKLPTDKEVDHKVSIKKGGTNSPENLRVVSRGVNRRKGTGK